MRYTAPLLLATLLATARAADPAPAPVAFDWFEYTGRDAAFAAPLPAGHFRNPILAGYYPDPSICRVGDDYYLINSTFAHFPGIPVHHSRDLVNWRTIGHVIDRPGQLKYEGLGISRGIFAPAISHHNGVFYVVCTMVDAGGNFVVTATDPAGPWSDPVWFDIEGIDPSLFFDDDGRAWLVNNGAPVGKPLYDGHRCIWIQEFDPATKKLVGPRSVLVNGGVDITQKPVWIEGPHIYKRDGWYYLCCAEGGTSTNHSQVIHRSRAVTGPYTPWDKNPILTQRDLDNSAPLAVTSTGHADLVEGPDGNWWAIFLACRPYAGRFYNTGRETFLLPVQWPAGGWPTILPPGERVPYVVKSPQASTATTAPSHEPAPPLTGNFTWRDEFAAPTLSPLWLMLRTPSETWWRQSGGNLSLDPRTARLTETGNPSFLGRRLQHARFDASTSLVVPASSRVTAGLVAFQGEKHHYTLGVRRNGDWMSVFVERQHGERRELLANQIVAATARIELHLKGDDQALSFSYTLPGGTPQTLLPHADATVLSTQTAGGFVGVLLGVHARLDP